MTLDNHGPRMGLRASTGDLQAMEAITAHLRAVGTPFANRTDAIRFALKVASETIPPVLSAINGESANV